jgi:hypothetical protein
MSPSSPFFRLNPTRPLHPAPGPAFSLVNKAMPPQTIEIQKLLRAYCVRLIHRLNSFIGCKSVLQDHVLEQELCWIHGTELPLLFHFQIIFFAQKNEQFNCLHKLENFVRYLFYDTRIVKIFSRSQKSWSKTES